MSVVVAPRRGTTAAKNARGRFPARDPRNFMTLVITTTLRRRDDTARAGAHTVTKATWARR